MFLDYADVQEQLEGFRKYVEFVCNLLDTGGQGKGSQDEQLVRRWRRIADGRAGAYWRCNSAPDLT